jgi:hypothetical protein
MEPEDSSLCSQESASKPDHDILIQLHFSALYLQDTLNKRHVFLLYEARNGTLRGSQSSLASHQHCPPSPPFYDIINP